MRASITVMMSLVSLIILAMTGTCIETARYSVCAGSGTESLRSAADALFTEYSRPLYDHYGLFFLESVGTPHEEVISRYLGDDLEGGAGFLDFLKGELKSLDIRKKTLAGDDGAEPLMKEIVQYMERYVVSEALGGFMKKLGSFSDHEA
ncbi:MAG: hypothetical protein J6P16_07180 [Eubacterium sp.]|nr:hypothetical protein [Eubacterium sp.]